MTSKVTRNILLVFNGVETESQEQFICSTRSQRLQRGNREKHKNAATSNNNRLHSQSADEVDVAVIQL